jgi:hypothetical protein
MDQKSEDTRRMPATLADDNSRTFRRNQHRFAQKYTVVSLAASLLSYWTL